MRVVPMQTKPRTRPARSDRLAELVAELTGCDSTVAGHAIRAEDQGSDPLAVVARAMRRVDDPSLGTVESIARDRGGLRVAGYLREDLSARRDRPRRGGRLPHRVSGGLPRRMPLARIA